jgi:hypothetical protein
MRQVECGAENVQIVRDGRASKGIDDRDRFSFAGEPSAVEHSHVVGILHSERAETPNACGIAGGL